MPETIAPAELKTLRDFLRYAVSRFRAANLFHGHGATNALDEAVFIILEALHLPVDDINPWLDARLTRSEADRLASLIETRVTMRKPAAYLLNRAYIQGAPFYVDERVIVPRSFIGELLFQEHIVGGEGALIPDPNEVLSVLDLCTGSGCLAILAARAFPNATIDAVDLSKDALDVARRNVDDYGLGDRITLHQGDLFAPLKSRRYDLIITNPPYVDAETMAALPPEFRAEPEMALAGGEDGFDIVRRILAGASGHLTESGGLLCEIGTDRDVLDRDYPGAPFLWLDSEESEGEVFWIAGGDIKL
ncbi:50S ribosomal protein L3 N(5)-glutamine methyltransferase [Terrarubrum flagellatum]|uniref:50S ribosomal protein L3 N(5)-glutamine methyltransferase n=1 Tax=Terrirubrum flagellatum TaxID=2895980 RepID=UPI0031453072